MNAPDPTMRLKVDVLNPGQFFACCGLLELASRLDGGSLAWFDADGGFCLAGGFGDLLRKFRNACFSQPELDSTSLRLRNRDLPKMPETVKPIEIRLSCGVPLLLDWWLRPSEHNGLKLWSGSNSVFALFKDGFEAIRQDNSEDILTAVIQLRRQPFFYAASRPLHERDFGVSLDKIGRGIEFEHFPYVELLTVIALQRFRPLQTATREFRYCSWVVPLPAEIAGAVVAGGVQPLAHEVFAFPVIKRDDKGHKQFTRSERR
jgi:CRISPR-associated protein Csx14